MKFLSQTLSQLLLKQKASQSQTCYWMNHPRDIIFDMLMSYYHHVQEEKEMSQKFCRNKSSKFENSIRQIWKFIFGPRHFHMILKSKEDNVKQKLVLLLVIQFIDAPLMCEKKIGKE